MVRFLCVSSPAGLLCAFPYGSCRTSSRCWCTSTCSGHEWRWHWCLPKWCQSPSQWSSNGHPMQRSAHLSGFHNIWIGWFMIITSELFFLLLHVQKKKKKSIVCMHIPGVIMKIMHVLLMFIHKWGYVVKLHLEVHRLQKIPSSGVFIC